MCNAWKATFVCLLVVCLLAGHCGPASAARRRKKKPHVDPVSNAPPMVDATDAAAPTGAATVAAPTGVHGSVWDRGLVTKSVSWNNIVPEHHKYWIRGSQAELSGEEAAAPVLGYVTPWNREGMRVAEVWAKRFTMISPVWFQVGGDPGTWAVTGHHDVDQAWVSRVRRAGGKQAPLIVPRFRAEWSSADWKVALRDAAAGERMAKAVADTVYQNGFDGAVLDLGYMTIAGQAEVVVHAFLSFMRRLADALHAVNAKFILVIGSWRQEDSRLFTPHQIKLMSTFVDHFSVMTYDFSSGGNPGPNAPLHWVASNTMSLIAPQDRQNRHYLHKFLIGLPWYGYEFGNGKVEPVTGPHVVKLLQKYKPDAIDWHERWAEHTWRYFNEETHQYHTVVYPTLASVAERMALLRRMGVGAAIWELGQGLDYFHDLLMPR